MFAAPPQDPDRARGVAGSAAAEGRTVEATGLPDLSDSPTESDFVEYGKKTACDPDWLRVRRPSARALVGFPVEVNGRVWGSVVVDSRAPELEMKKILDHHRATQDILHSLLQGV